jgi:hypothetical protein
MARSPDSIEGFASFLAQAERSPLTIKNYRGDLAAFAAWFEEVNGEPMEPALAEFARWADPAGEKVLLLLLDNAGWHVAKRLVVPPDVVLHPLPSCTPELQPAEPLWPLVREAVANRGFAGLDEMEPVLIERCRWLIDHPEVVRGVVGFQWAAVNG